MGPGIICLDTKHHSFADSWEEGQRDLLPIIDTARIDVLSVHAIMN